MKRIILLFIIISIPLAGCGDIFSSEPEMQTSESMTAQDIPNEPNNAMIEVERERDFFKSVAIFQQNRDQFTDEQLATFDLPRVKLWEAYECMKKCDSSILAAVGLPACGVTQQQEDAIEEQIKQMFCVPFEIRYSSKRKQDEILSGIEKYDSTSTMVYCYRSEGDLLFHIKNNQIIEIFN